MPSEKAPTKCSENRRSNKPIMEKRRRARINSCLNDLKALILEALKKDPARHSKLEKADILEMTVKHLQNLQRQQMALTTATDPNVANKFRAGFNECATEVTRYLSHVEGLDPSSRQRLSSHLTNCLSGLGNVQSFGLGGLAPTTTVTPPMAIQPLNIHVPMVATGQSGQMPLTPCASPTLMGDNMDAMTSSPTRLHLVPTRLPNGDFALLLPSSYALTTNGQTNNVSLPRDTNVTNVSNNTLAPPTVNLSSRLTPAAPSDVSPMKQPMMTSQKTQQIHRGIVKMEPQIDDRYSQEQFIKAEMSCRSYGYDGYSSPVRSEVFCKNTMHKLEPWRPW